MGTEGIGSIRVAVQDTLGGYALTLVDSLDMLALIGNKTEFAKSVKVRRETMRTAELCTE